VFCLDFFILESAIFRKFNPFGKLLWPSAPHRNFIESWVDIIKLIKEYPMKKCVMSVLIYLSLLISSFHFAEPISNHAFPVEIAQSLEETAEDIAGDEGVVLEVEDQGSETVIYIFEERHDSILGQIEIAMMLDNLYADYDLRLIGLEGLTVEDGPLDLSYMHVEPYYQPDQPITNREDVLVQTLQEGEIGSAELLGLVYHDMVIAGIDDAALYSMSLDLSIWYTAYDHNYQIMSCEMTDEQFDFWRELMEKEEYQMAYDYAIQNSPSGQEMVERIQGKNSAEDFVQILDELETGINDCAEKYGNPVPPKMINDMAALRDYMDVVMARSDAMASALLDLITAHPGAPIATTIGVMHTARIVDLISDAGFSVVVFRPTSLEDDNTAGLIPEEAYLRKQAGGSVTPEGYIASFFDNRDRDKKYPTSAEKEWYLFQVKLRMELQKYAYDMTKSGAEAAFVSYPDVPLIGPNGKTWGTLRFVDFVPSKDPNNPHPIIEWEVTIENPDILGWPISVMRGTAQHLSGQEQKLNVVHFGRLDYAKEMILNQHDVPEQETTDRGGYITQRGCSDTDISITGVSD